jgi:hypothetical protein
MTINATVTRLDRFTAPYGKEVTLENVAYDNGMRVLRVHIREGNRFTVMDLDAGTALKLGSALTGWAGEVVRAQGQEPDI